MLTITRSTFTTGLAPNGKRKCAIFTLAVGGDDRARPQEIEQEGQERISRLAARNGRALRTGRWLGDQAHGRHRAGRGRRGNRPWTLLSKGQTDIRDDIRVAEQVLAFIAEAGAKSVVMTDRIIGCPHESIDYEGATCPACPFWAGRDRWTGKRLH